MVNFTKAEFDEATGQWVEATGRPDARVAEWDGSKWTEVGRNPSGPGAISRGLTSGIEGTKGLLFDVAPAMVQQALGYEEASKRNLEAYRKRMQQLQESGKGSRVGLEDVKDLSSFLSFAGEAFGEAIPSMATALAGGAGAAAGAARLGAGRLLSGQVAKRAAELEGKTLAGEVLSKEAALALATKEASQKVGQVAGALGGSALLNIPESYASLEEAGVDNLGVAFGVGALKSTLDALGPIRMLSKTRGPDFSDKLTDLISARLLKGRPGTAGFVGGTLETTALEGLTEGAQELLDQTATAILADKSIDWKQVLEAAAKGGIGAAPIGGAAGAYGARNKAAAAAEAQTATEEKTAAQEAEKQRRTQETEAALSFPEDYAIRREFGEIKDSAGYSQLADFFAAKAKAKGTSQESRDRYWEQAKRYNELARTADTENLVARLAKYYNFNEEQEAALLRYASDFGGPGRVEFEKFVSDALQDPAAVGAIPGLQTVEFLSVKPEKTAQLALPAPSEFAYDIGEFTPEDRLRLNLPTAGILTPKQADAYINSFISRPVAEGADIRDRVNKLEQLQQLDPKINPEAGTIDPNERRRLALNIITGGDIQQIQQPTETRLPSGETVETKEPLERVTPAGQVGTREGTLTYENLYQRIVDNLPNAPTKVLELKWLQEAAGFKNLPPPKDPQDAAAAKAYAADKAIGDAVRLNAKYIWPMLVQEGRVEKRGFGYKVRPEGLRLQELGEKEIDRIVNLPRLQKALDAEAGKGKNLGLSWLTKAVQLPAATKAKQAGILPREAQMIWDRLEEMGYVTKAGAFYKALPKDQIVAKPPKPKPPAATPPAAPPAISPLGTLPPNLPAGRWSYDGMDLLPDQRAKSDPQLEAEAKAGWAQLQTVDEKVAHLRNTLLTEERRTGYEHSSVFDPAGNILFVHTDGNPAAVRIPLLYIPMVVDPANSFIFQHSHPNNSGSSGGDVRAFYYMRGVSAHFAHGSKGADSVVFSSLRMQGYPDTVRKSLTDRELVDIAQGLERYHNRALRFFHGWVASNITSKTSGREDRFLLAVSLANIATTRTGLVDFADTSPESLNVVPGWEAAIETRHQTWMLDSGLSNAIGLRFSQKEIDAHGRQFADNYRRHSQSLRQPGGIAKLLQDIGAAPPGSVPGSPSERISGVSEDTTGANRNREGAGPESEALVSRSEALPPDKSNIVKGVVDQLTQTSRRGFLRGAGSAAMSAGLPGTQAIKQARDTTGKIQDLNTTIRKLNDIFRSGDMGGLWKIPEPLQEPSVAISRGDTYLSAYGADADNTWANDTLQDQKKVRAVVENFQDLEVNFLSLHPRVKRILEVKNAEDSLGELDKKYELAFEQFNDDLAEKAGDLNSQLPHLDLADTPLRKKLSGHHLDTLKILFDFTGLNGQIYDENGRLLYRSLYEGLNLPVNTFADYNFLHVGFSDTFNLFIGKQNLALAEDAARRAGLDKKYDWSASTPEGILNRVREVLPTIEDPQLRNEAARFVREATEFQNLTAEDMRELDATISKVAKEYVAALPKAMSELQKFARLHNFTTKVLPEIQSKVTQIQKVYEKYEARDLLERRKDSKSNSETSRKVTPRVTTLAQTVFKEISLPRGTPAQMQKQVDQMFDRMQRLQKAADDAIPDDYSCG